MAGVFSPYDTRNIRDIELISCSPVASEPILVSCYTNPVNKNFIMCDFKCLITFSNYVNFHFKRNFKILR